MMDNTVETKAVGVTRTDAGKFVHAHECVGREVAMLALGASGAKNVLDVWSGNGDPGRPARVERALRKLINLASHAANEIEQADFCLSDLREDGRFLHIAGRSFSDGAVELLAGLSGADRERAVEAMNKIVRERNASVRAAIEEKSRQRMKARRSSRKPPRR